MLPEGDPFLFEGAPNGGTNSYRAERYDAVQPYFQDDWKVTQQADASILVCATTGKPIPSRSTTFSTTWWGRPSQPNFVNVPHAYQNNPANKNFDPRVGLAWDVFGDHKTAAARRFRDFPRSVHDLRFLVRLRVQPAV